MAETRENRIRRRAQDPRTVDPHRNDDPADFGSGDRRELIEERYGRDGEPVPVDLLFR